MEDFTRPLLELWQKVSPQSNTHPNDAQLLNSVHHNLQLGREPEPWFGIPSKAKVFYLTLNPNHDSTDKGTTESLWQKYCYDMMKGNVSRDRFVQEAPPSATQWLSRAHGKYAHTAFYLICNLRLVAYPSSGKEDMRQLSNRLDQLHTTTFIRKFVHSELVPRAKRGEIALLVLRSAKEWGFVQQEKDVVDGSLIISKPGVRRISVSPGSRFANHIRPFLE